MINVTISPQALERLTKQQIDKILGLVADRHAIYVNTQFDLPSGWVGFELTYHTMDGGTAGTKLYGGIAPDGSAST